ncbi:hypothetical protein SBV1_1390007 [Verrucomicrobia bacterium]|nr:hypothetical protein SBV1_1390007 [Verrucomicrobiota bacterium]
MLLTYSPSPGPLCQHGLLKYDLRISVKDYHRGKKHEHPNVSTPLFSLSPKLVNKIS